MAASTALYLGIALKHRLPSGNMSKMAPRRWFLVVSDGLMASFLPTETGSMHTAISAFAWSVLSGCRAPGVRTASPGFTSATKARPSLRVRTWHLKSSSDVTIYPEGKPKVNLDKLGRDLVGDRTKEPQQNGTSRKPARRSCSTMSSECELQLSCCGKGLDFLLLCPPR